MNQVWLLIKDNTIINRIIADGNFIINLRAKNEYDLIVQESGRPYSPGELYSE